MKKLLIFLLTLGLLASLAQEAADSTESSDEAATTETADVNAEDKRIISIDSSGGTRNGNLRFGPINYEHPDPEGVKATVSTLAIFAQNAQLRGPDGEEDVTLTEAKGRRIATFNDGVRVERGRLNAAGPDLFYSEAEGLGNLTGGVDIEIAPKNEGDDFVFIVANEAEFDVDTDVSVSRGEVQLENGNQSAEADEIEYEEERALGVLSCTDRQCTITRLDDNGDVLTITADTIRVLSDDKKLHALGNVTVVDGSITSTGDEVFFDDEESLAEVIGNPAEAVDEAEGATVSGARLLQDIEFDIVELMNEAQPSAFQAADYLLTREQDE